MSDPLQLYSERVDSYLRFVRWMRYPAGVRAYFVRSRLLRSHLRVLDAGCGTGIVTLALREALVRLGFTPGPIHAFDLTPAMLDRFRGTLRRLEIHDVELEQADALALHQLPSSWRNYDLVVSAAMLEYLPRAQMITALGGLRSLLSDKGTIVLFITRRNWLTRPLIGWWWDAHLYNRAQLAHAFREAGFTSVSFRVFPALFRYLSLWGHIVEARA